MRALRGLVPFRAPDISPHERKLTAAEIAQFSRHFARHTTRAFWLPFGNVITPSGRCIL